MENHHENSCEPMDIDLSSHSVSAMDISYIDRSLHFSPVSIKEEKNLDDLNVIQNCSIIKPLSINNLIAKQKQASNNTRNTLSKILMCIIALFLSVIIYQFTQFTCNENLNFHLIKSTLSSKLYGQSSAVESLVKALETEASTKIIILYGGTGVGKTYTASLILENIINYSNMYHFTMPGFLQTSPEYMFGLSFCQSSIIVVDDLKGNDIINIKDNINALVRKSEDLSKKITILLLYNCDIMSDNFFKKCDIDFVKEVNQTFHNKNMVKNFIKFESLNEKHLKMCIENEAPNNKLSENKLLDIMKNFNVGIDGCKGVYQKMKYLNVI